MRITARKVWVSFASAYPYRGEFAAIAQAVRAPARVAGSLPCAIPTGTRRGRASPRAGRGHAETPVPAVPTAAGLRPSAPKAAYLRLETALDASTGVNQPVQTVSA